MADPRFGSAPNVRVIQCEWKGAKAGSNADRTQTTAAIQAALSDAGAGGGGTVTLTESGVYYQNGTTLIGPNTEFYLGNGVEIRMSGTGRNVMRTGNVCWSELDAHVLNCIVPLAAVGSAGIGTVKYTYGSTTTVAGGYAQVTATLAYKGPTDSAYGTAASIPVNPGGKMRLVSANGINILWVSVGNMCKGGGPIAESWLPATSTTERVKIVDNGAAPVAVTWTYATINGLPIITVYEPNHTRQPGDKIEMLKGSGLEGLFEVYNIGNSVTYGDAGTDEGATSAFKNANGTVPDYWTIMPSITVNASYWSGLAASGSAYVHGLRKIYWRGPGLLNYNKDGVTSLPSDNMGSGIIINGVSDYGVFETRLSATYGHGWFSSNVAKARADLGESLGYYGIWNPRGPIRDMEVRGVRGRADDNACDLGTSDYANYIIHFPAENCSTGQISATDVFDVRYRGLASNQTYEVTRLYASNGSQIVGWVGENITGISDQQANAMMNILTDDYLIWTGAGGSISGTGAPANGALFKDLTFRDYGVQHNPYWKKTQIQFAGDCSFSNVLIDGITLSRPDYTDANCGIYVIGQMLTPLRIRNAKYNGTYRGYVVKSSTTTNAGVDIDGCTLKLDSQASGLVINTTGATVSYVNVTNANISDGNYIAASAVVAAGGTGYSNGNVLTLVGGTLSAGGAAATFTVATSSGGVVQTVTLTTAGAYMSDGKPTNPVTVTGGGGSACTLTVTWTEGGSNLMLPVVNQGNMNIATIDRSVFKDCNCVFYGNSTGAQPTLGILNTHMNGGTYLINLNQAAALKGIDLHGLYGKPYQLIGGSVTGVNMPLSGSGFGNFAPSSAAWALSGAGSIRVSAPDLLVDIAGTGTYVSSSFGAIFKASAATGTLTAGMLVVSNATTSKFVAAHNTALTS